MFPHLIPLRHQPQIIRFMRRLTAFCNIEGIGRDMEDWEWARWILNRNKVMDIVIEIVLWNDQRLHETFSKARQQGSRIYYCSGQCIIGEHGTLSR